MTDVTDHIETPDGYCRICGSAWPCAVWVDEREAWERERDATPTCDSCGRWVDRHPWTWCKLPKTHSCPCPTCTLLRRVNGQPQP